MAVPGDIELKYQTIPVKRSVFRAYDIRGVVEPGFDEQAFFTIGKAIACRLYQLDRHKIFLARDGRLSSLSLAKALKQGLLNSGITVIDLGAVATPVMYFATHTQGVDCGLMVTGSHNPADYNGIKMVLAGKTLVQADIDSLFELVAEGTFINGLGKDLNLDIIPDYIHRILTDIRVEKPLKVVVDCGNGIAGSVIPGVIEALGCEVIPLFCEVDGRFPNHHPDPTIEANLVDLQKAVLEHRADVGFAFDGDADRLGVVTNSGRIIWPDRLMMFYSRALLRERKEGIIVYDVKCSSHLKDVIEESGGTALMCPTGHSIVKAVMKKCGAVLAGEMSGHLFFKDRWYGFDDALYSAARFLEIISQSVLSVDEQFLIIPDSINTPEIKVPISDEEKFQFMNKFSSQMEFPAATILKIDGVRIEFAHGWGLVRASNTTPCLVLRFEARDEASLVEIQNEVKTALLSIDEKLSIPF